jgi:hypothetical protein
MNEISLSKIMFYVLESIQNAGKMNPLLIGNLIKELILQIDWLLMELLSRKFLIRRKLLNTHKKLFKKECKTLDGRLRRKH